VSATSAGLQQSFEFVRLGLNGRNPARNSRPCVADTPRIRLPGKQAGQAQWTGARTGPDEGAS